MPSKENVKSLREICVNRLVVDTEVFWIERTKIKSVIDGNPNILYMIGPFESLDEVAVNQILKKLYQKMKLTKYHVYLCINSSMRRLDFSFIKKGNVIDNRLCSYIGVNSYKLTELNLSFQKDITPLSLCNMLEHQKQLKRLNLSHTQANIKVMQTLAHKCMNLEEVCLSNCKFIDDDSLLYLTSYLSKQLTSLNVDFVDLTNECIEEILTTCSQLKFFYTENLLKIIYNLQTKTTAETVHTFNLETIYCDNKQIYLSNEIFGVLAFSCPKIKNLQLNCLGQSGIFDNLKEFPGLNQLLVSNQNVLTYKFDNYLSNYLALYGHGLKKLHLIHIDDVNLRAIVQSCTSLHELIVEFIHYYNPAGANSEEYELTELEEKLIPDLPYLETLELSNTNCTTTKPYLNIPLLKFDIKLLLRKSRKLKKLKLECFNFIDDDYLTELIQSMSVNVKATINTIELIQLNYLFFKPISRLILFNNEFKNLRVLCLDECKQISKSDHYHANKRLKLLNINCHFNWR